MNVKKSINVHKQAELEGTTAEDSIRDIYIINPTKLGL